MIRTHIAGLRAQVGSTVTIAGWVQALRLQRAMQFVVVRDHTGAVQVTRRRDGGPLESLLDSLTAESAVRITGVVKDNPVVSLGGLELVPETAVVENLAATPLPIDDRTGPEGRLDWRFLDVRRRPAARLVFAVQTTVERAMREFAFVTEYPASVRPFHHLRPAAQPHLTASFDLLWKGLEITTGAQREHRYDVLLAQAAEKGLAPEPMRSYLDCFRFGCPPHGGFGLGLGRLLMVLLGLDSIRDATFLFRGPNRLVP